MNPTTNIPQTSPADAKRLLDAKSGYIYLDVRTVPEFNQGHAPGALNIPIAEMNPAIGRMEMNQRFVDVVQAHIPSTTPIIVGCGHGQRSQTAAEILVESGYKKVHNLAGGFHGETLPSGEVTEDGWCTSGFPVERGDGGPNGYAALSASANPSR